MQCRFLVRKRRPVGCVGPWPRRAGAVGHKPRTPGPAGWGAWAPGPVERGLWVTSPGRHRRPARLAAASDHERGLDYQAAPRTHRTAGDLAKTALAGTMAPSTRKSPPRNGA